MGSSLGARQVVYRHVLELFRYHGRRNVVLLPPHCCLMSLYPRYFVRISIFIRWGLLDIIPITILYIYEGILEGK